jgi:tRNA(Arg) A34 adenosine deaminase TadA
MQEHALKNTDYDKVISLDVTSPQCYQQALEDLRQIVYRASDRNVAHAREPHQPITHPELSRRGVLRRLLGVQAAGLLGVGPFGLCMGLGGCSSNPLASTPTLSAEKAALRALDMAKLAAQAGTFGVGGVLIDNASGRVVHALSNQVMGSLTADESRGGQSQAYTQDPMAHGETGLVRWYFANAAVLQLPPPEQLTIVTTLDPCAMCTGALLATGFNVAVVADDTYAGINWTGQQTFSAFPEHIRQRLERQFSYLAIETGRTFAGRAQALYARDSVSAETAHACSNLFSESVKKVRLSSSGAGLKPTQLIDPISLPIENPARKGWHRAFPDAFSIRLNHYRQPDIALRTYLEKLVQDMPGSRNAVAFIDSFGNLLMAAPDSFDSSPIATAFMNLTQAYARLRFNLMNDPLSRSSAESSFTAPRYGTIVFLYALDPGDPLTLKDLGAYGSTLEGAIPISIPSHFQFYYTPQKGTVIQLKALIAAMPPFYNQLVNIDPQPVP